MRQTSLSQALRKITAIALSTLPLFACSTAPRATASVEPTPQATPIRRAQAEQSTVVDYFLQAPAEYFAINDRGTVVTSKVRQKLLQSSGAIIDQTNGYIRTSSTVPDLCNYEMAIFRRSKGAHLVALNLSCTVSDKLVIFDPDKNWQDVTASVFPVDLNRLPAMGTSIKLPRYGREIEILDENNQRFAQTIFEGDRFRLIK
jgi:hypothetical protein